MTYYYIGDVPHEAMVVSPNSTETLSTSTRMTSPTSSL